MNNGVGIGLVEDFQTRNHSLQRLGQQADAPQRYALRTRLGRELRFVGMLLTIAVILVALWLLGFVAHVAGGLIHIVLVVAVVMFLLHFLRGRTV